jgi:hypothetical protein
MCRNAYAGMSAWFCYFYGGKATPGKEALDAHNRCEACAKVAETVETLPSFMLNEED